MDACDAEVLALCPPPPGAATPLSPWPLGAVKDCLWAEVESDRDALADAAAAAGQGGGGGPAVRRLQRATPGDADAGAADGEEGADGEEEAEAEAPRRTEPVLSQPCRAFLDVALPEDLYDSFQGSMTATAVITQLASIEGSLGLKAGTLHHAGGGLAKRGWLASLLVAALCSCCHSRCTRASRQAQAPHAALTLLPLPAPTPCQTPHPQTPPRAKTC